MKNLNRVKGSYTNYFKNIVKEKYNPGKNRLENLESDIKKRYVIYMREYLNNKFEDIPIIKYTKIEKKDLENCYLSPTKTLNKLIKLIRSTQDRDLQGTCQYCGLAKPRTIDHYLPKGEFPDFSVLALNLIPCCQDCNGKKSEFWKNGNKRGIINYYLDILPTEQFLFVSIKFNSIDEIPVLTYNLDFPLSIDYEIKEIIESHFTQLELCERYSEESHDYVSNLVGSITNYLNSTDKDEIKQRIVDEAIRLAELYGINNWKSITNYSLAHSNDFINLIIRKINSY